VSLARASTAARPTQRAGRLSVRAAIGSVTVQGTSRTQNEDRAVSMVNTSAAATGKPYAYVGVFDGHGGFASAEWLEKNLYPLIEEEWPQDSPDRAVRKAFIAADKALLAPAGFMGMGERGVGGSKCGSTGAVMLAYKKGDKIKVMSANCGDSRVLLIKDGQPPVQLSVDHVPDLESERQRIEDQKARNSKIDLVQYVGGTWRVGGLLALSRAFGDSYMKASGFNEGIADLGNDYSSGFGVIADPEVATVDVAAGDKGWMVVCSDGLIVNEERGGGGGLDNNKLASIMSEAGAVSAAVMADTLVKEAVKAGSTDDVTVVCIPLSDLAA